MKLGSLREGRDGRLVVVSRDGSRFLDASGVAPTLQAALDDWDRCAPALEDLSRHVESGDTAFMLKPTALGPPLPRAYEWVDGSAYVNHIVLVRKARKAYVPPQAVAAL